MEINEMDFKEYCCLNRPFLRIDEEYDAEWFFGNKTVEDTVIGRVESDINIRGVPKCGVLGRWGIGKTHTLNHLKWLFTKKQGKYKLIPISMLIAPWDDANPRSNDWGYIHRKMIDAIGEHLLRQLVTSFAQLPQYQTKNLSESLDKLFKFGDANLRYSLADVLANNFLRPGNPTADAWEWLRGDKPNISKLQVNRTVESVQDMVDIIRNIGILTRTSTKCGLVFMIDEAHALSDAKKKHAEIHYGFKELADQVNHDVGFILAIFGSGVNAIPSALTDPKDILDRMGVTQQNMYEAFIELKDVTATEKDLKDFILNVLKHVKDVEKAKTLISESNMGNIITPEILPFTHSGINELIDKLKQKEETKAPRMIIENLAVVANQAYQESKIQNKYVVIDDKYVNKIIQ
jgi:hypothetical protein